MIYIHKDHENRFLNDQLLIESDPEYWRVRDELSKHKLEQKYIKPAIRVGAAAKLKFTQCINNFILLSMVCKNKIIFYIS